MTSPGRTPDYTGDGGGSGGFALPVFVAATVGVKDDPISSEIAFGSGDFRIRRVDIVGPATVTGTWQMSALVFKNFVAWYEQTLRVGALAFDLTMMNYGPGVVTRVALFLEPYQAVSDDGLNYTVTAKLQIADTHDIIVPGGVARSTAFGPWDPTSIFDSSGLLSNSNKTFTEPGPTTTQIRGLQGYAANGAIDKYFEVTFNFTNLINSQREATIGITDLASGPIWTGFYAGSFGYFNTTGQKINDQLGGGVFTAYGDSWTDGDVIGVRLNNGLLSFTKNGVDQGVAFSLSALGTTTVYPAAGKVTTAGSQVFTINVGDSAFVGLPAGSSAWGDPTASGTARLPYNVYLLDTFTVDEAPVIIAPPIPAYRFPDEGGVTIAGAAPASVISYVMQPATADVIVTGRVPLAYAAITVRPDVGAIQITQIAPTFVNTGAFSSTPSTAYPSVGATWVSSTALVAPINYVPVYIKRARTIVGVSLLTLGGSGSCVVDIWKIPVGSYPPTGANSICASSKPTISGGVTYVDTTLTGWTTSVAAGDTLVFTLSSTSTFTLIAASLHFSEAI